MKKLVCIAISVVIFGVILHGEYVKTVVGGDILVARGNHISSIDRLTYIANNMDMGELKVEGVYLKNYALR